MYGFCHVGSSYFMFHEQSFAYTNFNDGHELSKTFSLATQVLAIPLDNENTLWCRQF